MLGCDIRGAMNGARGDLFPNLIGEFLKSPRIFEKTQGSQFSVFFFGGGGKRFGDQKYQMEYIQRKMSTNRNELVEPRKKPS